MATVAMIATLLGLFLAYLIQIGMPLMLLAVPVNLLIFYALGQWSDRRSRLVRLALAVVFNAVSYLVILGAVRLFYP